MSWMGLNTSLTGMTASQRNLYTVNHNVNNAEKEGYTRQVVKSSASIPLHIPGKGYIGTGISVDSVERVRSSYLDKKFRAEVSSLGNWDMKNRALSEIEGVLRGSDEEGINIDLDQLYKSLEELSNDPTDMAARTTFRGKAVSLTKSLQETVNRLYAQQKDLNFEVRTKVKQVNDYASQIGDINDQIFVMEVDGSNANDLRDQRDLLVDKLSQLVDIEVEEETLNKDEVNDKGVSPIREFRIKLGGKFLVNHKKTNKLKDPLDTMANPENDKELLYKVEWDKTNDTVELRSGEIKGLLDVRDGGNTGESNGIPFYIKRLDEFAKVFADGLNEIHKVGYNLQDTSVNGISLFVNKDSKDKDIRAENIQVSDEIMRDLNNIATKKEPTSGVEDSHTLKEMLKTRDDRLFFSNKDGNEVAYQGKPEDYFSSILSTLGVDNQQSQRMKTVQSSIVKGVTNQKLSVSGVNLDEEMANMVKFQKVYTASAKMVTTFDQIYDITINRLGMVGR